MRVIRDGLIERRLLADISASGRYSASCRVLSHVESVFGLPGQALDADMARFFDAFARLAEDPTSSTARRKVLLEGQTLAVSFRTLSADLEEARREADRWIRHHVEAVNELASRIATLNRDRSNIEARQTALHRDEIPEVLNALAQHLHIHMIERSENQRRFDICCGSGRPLVVGTKTHTLDAVSTGSCGFADLEHEGVNVTGEIKDGNIAGYIHARDMLIPGYVTALDELASELAQQVNTLHSAGFDLAGNSAGHFFTPPVAVPGADAALTVDVAILGDASLIAAAGIAQPGDNQIARAISDLRDRRLMVGGTATFNEVWGQLAFQVGRDTATALGERRVRRDAMQQTQEARDLVSSVLLDEGVMRLTRFQRAYEANTALLRTSDSTIDELMQMVGV